MAVFGSNAQQGLQLTVSERGAQETAGKLANVATAADRVGRAAGTGAASGIGRLRTGLTSLRHMATGLIGTFAKVGGMLGIGGAFAVGALVKDTLDAERALHRIAFQGNLGAKAMDRMRLAARSIAGETGKTRGEILGAIANAEDMGLSFEQAQEHMKNIVLWSDLLGVSADQASGAVGAINKALGGKGDVNQIMSMINAGAMNAGMDEGAFMAIIQKVAPQLQGVEGVGDITSFMQAIGGLGEEFAGDPRAITAGFKSINKTMNDPKLRKTFEKFGIQGDNASEVLISMAQKLARDAHSLDRAGLPDEIMLLASTIAGNLDKVNALGVAVQGAAGNTEDFAKRVADHAKDPEIAWAGTMERLKEAMAPLVDGLLGWVLKNKDEIIAGVQTFAKALGILAEWIIKLLGDRYTGTAAPGYGSGKGLAFGRSQEGQREAGARLYSLGEQDNAAVRAGTMSAQEASDRAMARNELARGSADVRWGMDFGREQSRLSAGGKNPMEQAIVSAIQRGFTAATGVLTINNNNNSDVDYRRGRRSDPALGASGVM